MEDLLPEWMLCECGEYFAFEVDVIGGHLVVNNVDYFLWLKGHEGHAKWEID